MTNIHLQTNCPHCGNLLTGFHYTEEKSFSGRVCLGSSGLEYDSPDHDIMDTCYRCEDCETLITKDEGAALAILIWNKVKGGGIEQEERQGTS